MNYKQEMIKGLIDELSNIEKMSLFTVSRVSSKNSATVPTFQPLAFSYFYPDDITDMT